jgi:hypothetical protein
VDVSFIQPNIADMLQPSMRTLTHLNIYIILDPDLDRDPLSGIPAQLEDMRSTNIIQSINLIFRSKGKVRHGNDWGMLDKVLTEPGWFNTLKQVSLAIDATSYYVDIFDESE